MLRCIGKMKKKLRILNATREVEAGKEGGPSKVINILYDQVGGDQEEMDTQEKA